MIDETLREILKIEEIDVKIEDKELTKKELFERLKETTPMDQLLKLFPEHHKDKREKK